jgi:hypothetical protein
VQQRLECSVCKLCKRVSVEEVIVVTNVKIVNKPINIPNGVFSGVTRTVGDQNWSRTPNIAQYYITLCSFEALMFKLENLFLSPSILWCIIHACRI